MSDTKFLQCQNFVAGKFNFNANKLFHLRIIKKKNFFYIAIYNFTTFPYIHFYTTVHSYSFIEPIFSDTKTGCLAKGRLSDKQTSV